MNPRENTHRENEEGDVLDGLASLPYHERLTKFIRGSTKHWVAGGVTIVDFRPLYAVTIHHLQHRLASELATIDKFITTDEQLEILRDNLHKYTDALRDFEFIHTNRWNTNFVKDIPASRLDNGKGSKLLAALIAENRLEAEESHRSLFKDSDLFGSFNHELMQQSTAIGLSLGSKRTSFVAHQERIKKTRITIRRFSFAIVGGLIIVVPMLILLIGEASTKSLAVISTSILVFAIIAAIFSNLEPESLLAGTAAYAAVLVTTIGNQ
ncbi:hypothetical protein F5Y19DRAFT_17931 [Xylariaceae sp. FL1651]|nr:hypothetical protein F5Y19DRAFT_17931 [Xylariaceae sp. FL1651]